MVKGVSDKALGLEIELERCEVNLALYIETGSLNYASWYICRINNLTTELHEVLYGVENG